MSPGCRSPRGAQPSSIGLRDLARSIKKKKSATSLFPKVADLAGKGRRCCRRWRGWSQRPDVPNHRHVPRRTCARTLAISSRKGEEEPCAGRGHPTAPRSARWPRGGGPPPPTRVPSWEGSGVPACRRMPCRSVPAVGGCRPRGGSANPQRSPRGGNWGEGRGWGGV